MAQSDFYVISANLKFLHGKEVKIMKKICDISPEGRFYLENFIACRESVSGKLKMKNSLAFYNLVSQLLIFEEKISMILLPSYLIQFNRKPAFTYNYYYLLAKSYF